MGAEDSSARWWASRYSLFLSAILTILTVHARAVIAQPGASASMNVRVTDSLREEPIYQAEVRLHTFAHPSPAYRAFTDGAGGVTFQGVEHGTYYLEVEKEGYESYREQVDLSGGLAHHFSVRLKAKLAEAQAAPGGTVSAAALIPGPARKAYEDGVLKLKTSAGESATLLRTAIKLYPKFPEAWAMLGLAYLRDKKTAEARAAFEKSIVLNPLFATPRLFLGKIKLEERDFEAAETELLEAQRLDPQAWDVAYELSRCYFNMGKMELALEYARKASASPNAATTTHLLLADIYLRLRDTQAALREMEEFLRVDGQSPFAERVRAKMVQLTATLNAKH